MSEETVTNEATDIENREPSHVGLTDLLGDCPVSFELIGAKRLSAEEVTAMLAGARYCSFLDDGTCVFYERPAIEAKK